MHVNIIVNPTIFKKNIFGEIADIHRQGMISGTTFFGFPKCIFAF